MQKWQSIKTYGNDRGLSCVFRQWRATHSHCSQTHAYSLGFEFVWESTTLDSRTWAFDFGGMGPIKKWLDHMFDHTWLLAHDDPAMDEIKKLAEFSTIPEYNGVPRDMSQHEFDNGFYDPTFIAPFKEGRICDLRIVPGVGCEMTAKMVYDKSIVFLNDMKSGKDSRYDINPDVRLVSVKCFEHAGNAAVYFG